MPHIYDVFFQKSSALAFVVAFALYMFVTVVPMMLLRVCHNRYMYMISKFTG